MSKKIFLSLTVCLFLLLTFIAKPAKAIDASAGQLVKTNESTFVMVLMGGKRHAVPTYGSASLNQSQTQYGNAVMASYGWSSAQALIITEAELNSYFVGENVTLKPNSPYLIKIASNAQLYRVDHDNHLLAVSGNDYPNYTILTISDANFTNYTTSPITTSAQSLEISNVAVSNITANSATVTWQSSSPDISYIMYGKENTPDGISYPVKDTATVTDHKLVISPLAMNTKYYFQIESNSLTSGLIESSVYDFTTLSTLPTVLSPNGGESWQSGKTYEIRWQVTNNIFTADRVVATLVKDNLIVASIKNYTDPYSATNGFISWTIPSTLPPGGGYSITVELCRMVSSNSCLSLGSDSSDSTFTITKAEEPRPDLTISELSTFQENGKIYLKVKINNSGAATPSGKVIGVKVEDLKTSHIYTSNYSNSLTGSAEITIPLIAPTSNTYDYELKVTIDPAGIIDESDETNNISNINSSGQMSSILASSISDIIVERAGASVTINWNSGAADISSILYGTENSDNGINRVAKDSISTTNHHLTIANLAPNTAYYYKILSNSLTSNGVESAVYDFTTLSTTSTEKSVTGVTKLGDGTYELNEGDKIKLDNGLMIVPVYFVSGSGSFEFRNVKFDVYLGATKLTTTDFTRVGWDIKTFEVSAAFYSNFNVKYAFKAYVDELATSGSTWKSKITFKSGDSVRKETGETITQKQETTKPVDQITQITTNANLLSNDKMSQILFELQVLRNTVQEQQTQIKYLSSLLKNVNGISAESQAVLNNFITYGVDANTVKLGAGERAAVINSYKFAFDKLPQTEAELADVIKIANGRFPSVISDTAEQAAKDQFVKIYKRQPDMNGAKDAAAVKIMSYGLRQKAENRNLNSEKAGIKIFKAIYGHTPKTTEEWNAMQAITYSGATQKTWSGYNPSGN